MPSYKEFTGAEDLEGMYKHVANVLVQSELGGRSNGYQLDHAGQEKSGFSFGGNQMDLAKGKAEYRELFNDIITNAKDDQGNPVVADADKFLERITPALHSAGNPHALKTDDKEIINNALGSEYGREKINNEFAADITERVNHVNNIIESLPYGDVRTTIQNSPELQIYLNDYHNQLGISPDGPMVQYLSGKEVTLNNGDTMQLNGQIAPADLLEFIRDNKQFTEHPANFEQRYVDVDKTYIDRYVGPNATTDTENRPFPIDIPIQSPQDYNLGNTQSPLVEVPTLATPAVETPQTPDDGRLQVSIPLIEPTADNNREVITQPVAAERETPPMQEAIGRNASWYNVETQREPETQSYQPVPEVTDRTGGYTANEPPRDEPREISIPPEIAARVADMGNKETPREEATPAVTQVENPPQNNSWVSWQNGESRTEPAREDRRELPATENTSQGNSWVSWLTGDSSKSEPAREERREVPTQTESPAQSSSWVGWLGGDSNSKSEPAREEPKEAPAPSESSSNSSNWTSWSNNDSSSRNDPPPPPPPPPPERSESSSSPSSNSWTEQVSSPSPSSDSGRDSGPGM